VVLDEWLARRGNGYRVVLLFMEPEFVSSVPRCGQILQSNAQICQMSNKPHAIVIGGSVGGLFVALLLRRIGWRVSVFERASDDLASRGAGAGMSAELFDVMRRIGIDLDPSIGVTISSYACVDERGNITHEISRHSVNGAWARVYRPLQQYFPADSYHAGISLESVEQRKSTVTAKFSNGSAVQGDLLIAADGSYSTVRQQFAPATNHQYAGYVAWRGLLTESELPVESHKILKQRIVFSLPNGELMLSMPVAGRHDGLDREERQNYFIWYRPVDFDTELPALCTDATGHCHGITIAPTLIRSEVIAELRSTAAAIFAPQVAKLVERVQLPLLQPIFDLESRQLVFGRTVLIGDAAFVARPHVAAGITKAALNAQMLADSMQATDNNIEAALAKYEATSLAFGSQMVSHARYLGEYIDAKLDNGTLPAKRNEPESYLREYGAPHLVKDPIVF